MTDAMITDETEQKAEVYTKQLIKKLAHNSKKRRNLAVTELGEWINKISKDANEMEFMKVWKGLFYCMWMCDKPYKQNELADTLSLIVLEIKDAQIALLYIRTFFKTMCMNWNSLDQHRLNKYYTFVRRMIRATLKLLKQNQWSLEMTDDVSRIMMEGPLRLDSFNQRGVCLQIIDVLVPELATAFEGESSENDHLDGLFQVVFMLFRPFLTLLSCEKDKRVTERVQESCFLPIITVIKESLESDDESESLSPLFKSIKRHSDELSDIFKDLAGDASTVEGMRKDLYHLSSEFKALCTEE